ncbi:MAG: heme A synthase, partial [Gammaproteobacteria bacterium]
WKVKPIIVTSHLIGGLATLTLLWLILLRIGYIRISQSVGLSSRFRIASIVGLLIVIVQIVLGGWTSSNYAALACPDFPTCQTQWWPDMDWKEGFVLWRGIGQDYEFGVLDSTARTAIHMAHRIGALVTFVYLGIMTLGVILGNSSKTLKVISGIVGTLLVIQVLLGISNIIFALPLVVATVHNGVGALLLLSMVTLVYAAYQDSAKS